MSTTFDTVQHKAKLQSYFNGVGFDRWSAIYGQSKLSGIRHSIREGHNLMMSQAAAWLDEHNLSPGAHILDAGCGTGLFSFSLAQKGYTVTAVDIAPQMVKSASQNMHAAGLHDRVHFVAGDIEVIDGVYDAVVCFDVLIHYPQPAFAQLCTRLVQRSRGPLIITYAPYNQLLAVKHWVGGYFPKSERRTTIEMIPDEFVRQSLQSAGMSVYRSRRISRGFYHVALLEARPVR